MGELDVASFCWGVLFGVGLLLGSLRIGDELVRRKCKRERERWMDRAEFGSFVHVNGESWALPPTELDAQPDLQEPGEEVT